MTLHEAESTLADARQRRQDAHRALSDARTRVTDLEGRIRAGDALSPDQLASAKAAVEHAELAHEGTEEPLRRAEEAAQTARAEEICDEVLAAILARGTEVVAALEALEGPIAEFVAAAQAYEATVRGAANLGTVSSARWHFEHYGTNRIDDVKIQSCRPMAQLARLLRPFVAELSVPSSVKDEFKLLAEGAPTIPVEDR